MGEAMRSASRRKIIAAMQVVLMSILVIASARAQAAQAEKPPMADDVFKNIQVLRGLTVDQFMGTMGFIAAALSLNCSECHDTSSSEAFAKDNPRKQMTRKMILMVDAFNKANFGGKREVTCYSCHRGDTRPKVTPSLADQYSTPLPDDPNEVEIPEPPIPSALTADQILDKYIQALGGAEKLAAIGSFVAHGTYQGFDTSDDQVPVDVYAKAPNQRSMVVHLGSLHPGAGDNVRVFDGRNAWNTSAGTFLPLPVLQLTDGEREGAALDAALSFPRQVKQALKNWQTGFPPSQVDENDVEVIQGTSGTNTPVKLYFDKKSGLLIRQVRYTDTVLGLIPTQIDYSDYRDVSGVKMPFHLVTTWTDGRSTTELTSIQANVAIDAAKFAKPTPATQKP
jgi:photosynthetic reaction center cytochrome c subunit